MKLTAQDIEIAVAKFFNFRQNIIVPNVSWGIPSIGHECDLLVVSPARFVREIEIKISKSDIKADLDKTHGHASKYIRELYYAVPVALADCKYLPTNEGLITVDDKFSVKVLRRTIRNRNAEALSQRDYEHLLHLGCMRIWSLKRHMRDIRTRIR